MLLLYSVVARHVNAQTIQTTQTEVPQQETRHDSHHSGINESRYLDLQDTLMKAKLAIADGSLEDALTDVRNVESQLLRIEPSPIQVLKVLHKAINGIARSDTVIIEFSY